MGLLPDHQSGRRLRQEAVIVYEPRTNEVAYLPPDYQDVPDLVEELLILEDGYPSYQRTTEAMSRHQWQGAECVNNFKTLSWKRASLGPGQHLRIGKGRMVLVDFVF